MTPEQIISNKQSIVTPGGREKKFGWEKFLKIFEKFLKKFRNFLENIDFWTIIDDII